MSYDTAFRELLDAGWAPDDAQELAQITIELQQAKEQEQCSEPS